MIGFQYFAPEPIFVCSLCRFKEMRSEMFDVNNISVSAAQIITYATFSLLLYVVNNSPYPSHL